MYTFFFQSCIIKVAGGGIEAVTEANFSSDHKSCLKESNVDNQTPRIMNHNITSQAGKRCLKFF